jgi:hypothetical protein
MEGGQQNSILMLHNIWMMPNTNKDNTNNSNELVSF